MIYRLCLHQNQVKSATKSVGIKSSSREPSFIVVRHADLLDDRVGYEPLEPADSSFMSLLRVNKIVHDESAPIFYGENDFHCLFGPRARSYRHPISMLNTVRRHTHNRKIRDYVPTLDVPDLAPKYLAMIRRLHLYLKLPPNFAGDLFAKSDERYNYKSIHTALAGLAESLFRNHSLRNLSVRINTTLDDTKTTPWENVYVLLN